MCRGSELNAKLNAEGKWKLQNLFMWEYFVQFCLLFLSLAFESHKCECGFCVTIFFIGGRWRAIAELGEY